MVELVVLMCMGYYFNSNITFKCWIIYIIFMNLNMANSGGGDSEAP